ncbi:unnamed protein product [Closterium sp. NIES-65]|nr:unnamed protein product [Closterium sp. NIES-65]
MFCAVFEREFLLMKRKTFLYVAQTIQIIRIALVTMTIFFRTMLDISLQDGNYYLCAMFFELIMMLFNGFTELTLLVLRLPIFYRQRDTFVYPSWAWEVPMELLSLPSPPGRPSSGLPSPTMSLALHPNRAGERMEGKVLHAHADVPHTTFFMQMFLFFLIHQVAMSLFRLIGALGRSMVVANTFGSFALILLFLLGGFVLAKGNIHNVWIWAYWISPLMYGQNALAVNEFLAPHWNVVRVSLLSTLTSDFGRSTLPPNGHHGPGAVREPLAAAEQILARHCRGGAHRIYHPLQPPHHSRARLSRS